MIDYQVSLESPCKSCKNFDSVSDSETKAKGDMLYKSLCHNSYFCKKKECSCFFEFQSSFVSYALYVAQSLIRYKHSLEIHISQQ